VGPSGADDLVADAVIKVFTHPGWPAVEHRRAYLYRAVLNAARQHERSAGRRRRREHLSAVPERVDAAPGVRPEVLVAMRALDPRQRAIVFLTYWQDRSTADIATELDLTPRTVQRELATARRRLEELLR
jgi:RNA polymerase sigma factor (sigma-70 family)